MKCLRGNKSGLLLRVFFTTGAGWLLDEDLVTVFDNSFERVLLIDNGKDTTIGTNYTQT